VGDRGDGAVGVDFVGGDGGAVADAGLAGLGDDGDSFGGEGYRKVPGAGLELTTMGERVPLG